MHEYTYIHIHGYILIWSISYIHIHKFIITYIQIAADLFGEWSDGLPSSLRVHQAYFGREFAHTHAFKYISTYVNLCVCMWIHGYVYYACTYIYVCIYIYI